MTSVYDSVGGDVTFAAIADALHARCLADPVLNHPFSHADGNPEHLPRLAAYLAEVFGGPPSGLGQSEVLALHAHQEMDHDLGDRFFACFLGALDEVGILEGRVRETMSDYMAWAVQDVLAYDEPDSVVPSGLAVPRWPDPA
jgi:hemoglobin